MEFPKAETSDNCAQHYVRRKHIEYTETTNLDKVCAGLEEAFAALKNHVGLDFVGHCVA